MLEAELIEGKNTLSLKLKLLKVSASYDKSNDFKYETLGTTNVELEIPKQLSKTKNIEINKQIAVINTFLTNHLL